PTTGRPVRTPRTGWCEVTQRRVLTAELPPRHIPGRTAGCGPDGPQYRRELLDPLRSPRMEPIKSPRLEAVEYGGICTLYLTVALGMRWRCVADLGAHLLAELNIGRTRELCTIVSDDAVGDAE